jgi:hypothetical protein
MLVSAFERLEPSMDNARSRIGTLISLGAAAGAFGVAAMMSAVSAPIARADDFTEIVSAVDADFAAGQADFTTALTDFGSSDFNGGLAALFNGVDTELVSAPDNLYLGTVDALTNTPFLAFPEFGQAPVANFADGVSDAQTLTTTADSLLSTVATELGAGDFADAAYSGALASAYSDLSWEVLLLGALGSLGL